MFKLRPPTPTFMHHVQVVSILTQALEKIPDADLAKVAARLAETTVLLVASHQKAEF